MTTRPQFAVPPGTRRLTAALAQEHGERLARLFGPFDPEARDWLADAAFLRTVERDERTPDLTKYGPVPVPVSKEAAAAVLGCGLSTLKDRLARRVGVYRVLHETTIGRGTKHAQLDERAVRWAADEERRSAVENAATIHRRAEVERTRKSVAEPAAPRAAAAGAMRLALRLGASALT